MIGCSPMIRATEAAAIYLRINLNGSVIPSVARDDNEIDGRIPIMTEHVTTTFNDGILSIQLNRPEKKNALTAAMYTALTEALITADQDDAVRVITLTGSGDSFTSGNDVTDFLQRRDDEGEDGSEQPVMRFLTAIAAFGKPLIAGVNGLAVGIGVTMLLHCDLVYASDQASFQLPFTNLGLVPEAASSQLLPQMIGYHRAAELMLFGERITAARAFEIGLINEVLPAAALTARIAERAAMLAAKPASSLLTTKALLKRAPEAVPARMAFETIEFERLLRSPEAKAIMRAFLDRKKTGI
jgi:enoyl-CoA hydratase/carnithine racemase